MNYFIAFLEGMITFISPCFLPMLPVYLSLFTGQIDDAHKSKTFINALGFVLGFTLIFVILGAFAGAIGGFLSTYATLVNLITGGIVIIFGLNFLGVLKISFLNRHLKMDREMKSLNFFSTFLFGVIFSIGWTPCVGAFLGSALMLAASSGQVLVGVLMLTAFSLGLGVPFIISALLIDRLSVAFAFIKRHYKVINQVSGAFLVVIGILMMTGLMGRFLALLSF